MRATTGVLPTDYTFTGQKLDASAGLLYYGARYYDAALGRFVQADTIVPSPGNPQALNRYAYTLNNPVKYVDPSEHIFLFAAMVVTGIIGGAAGFVGSVAGQMLTGSGSFSKRWSTINWKDVGVATAVSAAAGALAPITATTMAGVIATNAVASGVQYLATQMVNDKQVNALDLSVSVGLSGVAGWIAGPLKSANPLNPDLASPWFGRFRSVAKDIATEDLINAATAAPSVARSLIAGGTSNAPATTLLNRIKQGKPVESKNPVTVPRASNKPVEAQ